MIKKKRQAVFTWLNEKEPGIFLIQESHSSPEKEDEWRSMWDGMIEFSHGASNSRGVAVLISRKININITNIETDNDGRILLLNCTVSELNNVILNIYAPTIDKRKEQHKLAAKLELNEEKFNKIWFQMKKNIMKVFIVSVYPWLLSFKLIYNSNLCIHVYFMFIFLFLCFV